MGRNHKGGKDVSLKVEINFKWMNHQILVPKHQDCEMNEKCQPH